MAVLAGCASDTLEDGTYAGTITSSGCIAGQPFHIDVVAGKPLLTNNGATHCSPTAMADGDFDYSCSCCGGESHYACMSSATVREWTDVVHASVDGTRLVGTISRVDKTLAPPNCTVASSCVDTGTIELVRQQ